MRRFPNESFGMSQVGGIKDLPALRDGGGNEAIVNHGGGKQAES